MANRLLKSTKTTFIPGSPGVPSSPGQPYIPPYTSYSPKTVCSWKAVETFGGGAVGYKWVYVPPNFSTGWGGGYMQLLVDAYGNPSSGYVSTNYVYQCSTVMVATYYPGQPYIAPVPGVPPTPSQTIIDLNLGWNSGARSKGFLRGSGKVSFTASINVVGAVGGLNDYDVDAGYTSINYAWYLARGIARIYENGAEKAYIGPYSSGDVFEIRRYKSAITYAKNGTTVYTSTEPSSGTMFLDASLYSGGDYLDSPAIADYGLAENNLLAPLESTGRGVAIARYAYSSDFMRPLEGDGSNTGVSRLAKSSTTFLEPLTSFARGSSYINGGVGTASMEPLTSRLGLFSRGDAYMAPLVSVGSDRVYGDSSVTLEQFEVVASGGMPLPSFAVGDFALAYLTSSAVGTTGEIGGGANSLAPLISLGSGDDSLITKKSYGEAVVSMVPLISSGNAYEGNNNATLFSAVGMFGDVSSAYDIFVTMNSAMDVTSVFAVQLIKDGEVNSTVTSVTTALTQADLQALMRSVVVVGSNNPVFSEDDTVWVVNAVNGGTTKYEDYAFNSYAKIGDQYYGAKADGVYLLEGTDPVKASVNFGQQGFGSSALKTLENVYVTADSDGKLRLRVTVEGKTYIYTSRAQSTALDTHRIDVGRGLRAVYYMFELENVAGADFELSGIEFGANATTRRI